MSTLTQVEQATPATPSANQQVLYPKVGGYYRKDSAGTESQLLDSKGIAQVHALMDQNIHLGGGL